MKQQPLPPWMRRRPARDSRMPRRKAGRLGTPPPRRTGSVEPDGPVGTSGGVGRLKSWIDGRGALVGNADAYLADPARDPGKDIAAMLDGWDGETVRMLTKPTLPGTTGGFSGRRFTGFSLVPW